ncbi:5-formyltetrahydrofolate cyclo-ligase [Anaplasmataceae bacterium AB001_6]|nr:5-formyltetrahydrofolate cyclo-ligase [Anaplasmataceae bacterium AB001_6]
MMCTVKKILRGKFRQMRKSISNRNYYAQKLKENFIQNIQLKNTNIIGGYKPFDGEIDIFPLLEFLATEKKLQIAFPKIIDKNNMGFYMQNLSDDFIKDKNLNCYNPSNDRIMIIPDVLFVPLVSFNENCHRLGMGKGYYDKFINFTYQTKSILTIGFAYSIQKCENIPLEDHDQILDYVITEDCIYKNMGH